MTIHVDLDAREPRRTTLNRLVEDVRTGELLLVAADALVYDLSDLSPIPAGESLSFTRTVVFSE